VRLDTKRMGVRGWPHIVPNDLWRAPGAARSFPPAAGALPTYTGKRSPQPGVVAW
jgi:hypothetical protein